MLKNIELDKLIHYSDYIVVGAVTKIHLLEKKQIAELEVSRVVKGKTNLTRLFFYASPTWTCDTSNANEGETGVYFLESYESDSPLKTQLDIQQDSLREIDTITNGEPFFFITYSGRGRIVSKSFEGKEYLQTFHNMVLFPSTIKVLKQPHPEYSSLYYTLTTVDEVLNFIEKNM